MYKLKYLFIYLIYFIEGIILITILNENQMKIYKNYWKDFLDALDIWRKYKIYIHIKLFGPVKLTIK